MLNLENIEYAGWANCLKLSNGQVELVVTLEVGPRVIRYGKVGGANLFCEFADTLGQRGGDTWQSYGGHRLWHAPEVEPRTYFPDNHPVAHRWEDGVLTLTPPPEESNGLQLSIALSMDEATGTVRLAHRISNLSPWAVELAPWCLTVMAAGGRAIIPQEPFVAHGDTFLPARPLVIWPFADMGDPRYTWGTRYIQMRQDDACPSKQKIGALNTLGWAAYTLGRDVFVKRFPCEVSATYPDMGCNCEFFTMPDFLEVETLGALAPVEPGATVEHVETWGLFEASVAEDEASIDARLLPLVDQVPAAE